METTTTKQAATPPSAADLGDESFMKASDLRNYMEEMQLARAEKAGSSLDRAGQARAELIKRLSEPVDVTPERVREITTNLRTKLKAAAERGQTELMVMRFPVDLCVDRGRAINNGEKDWPETLTGRPRQAYELWRDNLKAGGFRLSALIVEWPGGLPGDVGLFLKWGEEAHGAR